MSRGTHPPDLTVYCYMSLYHVQRDIIQDLTMYCSMFLFISETRVCPEGYFHCNNGRCIPGALRCDKNATDHCGDNSDEEFCRNKYTCQVLYKYGTLCSYKYLM